MGALVDISRDLSEALRPLRFSSPVEVVYDPLRYAWAPHRAYLERFGEGRRPKAVLVGMNPGPFGMAQTGVPFGDVAMVRDWLGIEEAVGKPELEHPKRPVLGFDLARAEVSGTRLWGWAAAAFGTPEQFFAHYFIVNYCPLCFMEESGRNRTPNKLTAEERKQLFAVCDTALARVFDELKPEIVVGVGAFAERRARAVGAPRVGRILHPSPASPAANRGWSSQAEAQLGALGLPVKSTGSPSPG